MATIKDMDMVRHEALRTYLTGIPRADDYNTELIRSEAVSRINKAIGKSNVDDADSHPKWSLIKNLSISEIDIIIRALYSVKAISMADDISLDESLQVGVYQAKGPNEGLYCIDDTKIQDLIYKFGPNLTSAQVKDVMRLLLVHSPRTMRGKDKNLVPVNNGIWNMKTKSLIPFSDELIYMSKIPIDINPKAKSPSIKEPDGNKWTVDDWIKELSADDPEMEDLFWKIIAASLRPYHPWNKSVWLCSTIGNNGKGTFLKLIRNIWGQGNYASLTVSQFSDRFGLENLLRTSVVLADENDVGEYVDKAANYKAAVTGDPIYIDRKYKKSLFFVFQGLIIQCMNGFPQVRDKTNSFYRRLLLVPFVKTFEGAEKKYIKDDFIGRREVLEYVLWKCLNMDFDELPQPQACRDEMLEFHFASDPVLQFWEEISDETVWDFLPNKFLYDLFTKWVARNNPVGKTIGRNTFLSRLSDILRTDPEWYYDDKRKITIGNRCETPEELIIEYGLNQWMDPNYRGTDIYRKLNIKLPERAYGVVRVIDSVFEEE